MMKKLFILFVAVMVMFQPYFGYKSSNRVEASSYDIPDSNLGKDYNSWDEFQYNDLPAMEGIATETYNDQIYVGGRYPSSTETFTFDGLNWTNGPAFPQAVRNTNFVVFRNNLYKVGGTNSSVGTDSSVWRFNAFENSWDSVNSLPKGVTVPGLTVLGDALYAIGGYSSGDKNFVQKYNGVDWTDLSPTDRLPVNHSPSQGIVTYNDRVYITGVGGNQVYSYDGTEGPDGKWKAEPSLPAAMEKGTHVTKVFEDRIYTIGGTNVFSWKPGESEWKAEPTLPASRYRHGGTVLGEHLYVIGGSPQGDQKSTSNSVFRYPGSTVSLKQGSMNGGEELTITGYDLTNGDFHDIQSVTLGSSIATVQGVDTQSTDGRANITRIRVVTGSAPTAGKVDVVIQTTRGKITLHNAFEYVAEKSLNADLANLNINVGTLAPIFSSAITDYTTSVENSIDQISLTPTLADHRATMTINGNSSANMEPVTVPLTVGNNIVTITVTSENGMNTKTYTFHITRSAASPAPDSGPGENEPVIQLHPYEVIKSNEPWGATVVGSKMYYVEMNTKNIIQVSLDTNTKRVIKTDVTDDFYPFTGIAFYHDDVYLSTFNTIYKGKVSDIDSSNAIHLTRIKRFDNPSNSDPIGIAGLAIDVQNEMLYFSDQNRGKLYSLPLDQLETVNSEILGDPWFIFNTDPYAERLFLRGITFYKGSIYGISWTNQWKSFLYQIPIRADQSAGNATTLGELPVILNGPNSFLAGGPAITDNGKVYITDMTSKSSMITPPAPPVVANDDTNKIELADETMEYSEDNGVTWKKYLGSAEPLFSGLKTVLVRVSEVEGVSYASPATTLQFTPNPVSGNDPERKPTTTTVSSTKNPSTKGQLVTFTAITTAIPTSSGTLTGTVTFMDGTTVLATETLEPLGISNGKSKAVFSTSALNAGSHTITAVYSGDSHFAPGAFEPFTQVVTDSQAGGSNPTPSPTPSNPESGNGNNSGGGSTGSTPDPDEEESNNGSHSEVVMIDVDGESGLNLNKTPINRTTDANGKVKDFVILPDEIAKQSVQRAKETGNHSARIIIPDPKDQVSETNVEIPKSALTELIEGNVDLGIYTENATIAIPETSLHDFQDNLYFHLVPIKEASEKKQVEERAKKEEVVKQALGNGSIEVVGRPMTIETNLSSRKVDLILPLVDISLPTDTVELEEYLSDLAIYIEHSDGERVLAKPEVVEYKEGMKGLKFTIEKFSTFTIVKMDDLDQFFAEKKTHSPYIKGFEDGTFRPNAYVTRIQMAAMLARNLDKPSTVGIKPFKDVKSNHWAYENVMQVKSEGIMRGVTSEEFNPQGNVTRSQMALIAYRWIQQECKKDSSAYASCSIPPTGETVKFKDVSPKHQAAEAIAFLQTNDIMSGFEDGTFRPNEKLKRAQAVKVLNRLFKRGPWTGDTNLTFTDTQESHWAYLEIEEAARKHQYVTSKDGMEIIK